MLFKLGLEAGKWATEGENVALRILVPCAISWCTLRTSVSGHWVGCECLLPGSLVDHLCDKVVLLLSATRPLPSSSPSPSPSASLNEVHPPLLPDVSISPVLPGPTEPSFIKLFHALSGGGPGDSSLFRPFVVAPQDGPA